MMEYEILDNVPTNGPGLKQRMNEFAAQGYTYKGHIYDMLIFERPSAEYLESISAKLVASSQEKDYRDTLQDASNRINTPVTAETNADNRAKKKAKKASEAAEASSEQ